MVSTRFMITAATIALSCGFTVAGLAQNAVPSYVSASLADDSRYQTDLHRDAARKPADVVVYSGVKPGDKVAEILPGIGYWTRIVSKIVGPKGKVYAVVQRTAGRPPGAPADTPVPDPRSNGIDDALGMQNTLTYNNVTVMWQVGSQFAIPEQLDVVWAADAYHELHNKLYGQFNIASFNQQVFKALKPGGTLLLIDYAAAPGAAFTQTEALHRADKEAVKAELIAAGFTFDGESPVLANSGDDHTGALTGKFADDKADQYVLRFKKPSNAPKDKRPSNSVMQPYFGNTFDIGARTIWNHPDGTYQEFGANDQQMGTWFFDADGNSCQLHEFPAPTRALTTCHAFGANKKPGDKWQETNNGRASDVSLKAGHIYPPGVAGGLTSAP